MKYRELFESCDRILESPTIKMFDRYLLVNDLKNFYLESHNYIKDNIMSLPYEFENGLYNDYFIEADTETDSSDSTDSGSGDNKAKSTSTSDGWDRDSSGQFSYGSNTFTNILKSIMNFFIRLWKGIVGLFATWFNADSINNLAKGREVIANSADNPSAPSVIMNAPGILPIIDQTVVAIGNDPYLKGEFSTLENSLKTVLSEFNGVDQKRKEYNADETKWAPINSLRELVKDSFQEAAFNETLTIKPEYEGAKIRVFKYQAEKKEGNTDSTNAYASGGSKENDPNNYVEDTLNKATLVKYISEKLNVDEDYKKAQDTPKKEGEDAKYDKTNRAVAVVTDFMNNKEIHGMPVLIKLNYDVTNKPEAEIESMIFDIKNIMRTTKMHSEEASYHQVISSIIQVLMSSFIGILESSIVSMENMINAFKKIKIDNDKSDDPKKIAIREYNEKEQEALIANLTKASEFLFTGNNEGGEGLYARTLKSIAIISTGADPDNEEQKEEKYKTIDNYKLKNSLNANESGKYTFNGIGKLLGNAILFLIEDGIKYECRILNEDSTKNVTKIFNETYISGNNTVTVNSNNNNILSGNTGNTVDAKLAAQVNTQNTTVQPQSSASKAKSASSRGAGKKAGK